MNARTFLTFSGLVITGVLLVSQVSRLLDDPSILPPNDFVEYWAAGRLCLNGEDPYSPDLLLPLEKSAGHASDDVVMMWNPPWTLPVVMPVGALPPRIAQLVWLSLGIAMFAGSAALLGRAYIVRPGIRWVPWAVTFTFVPTFFALKYGQISPLLVLGAALFAWAIKTDRPFLAGSATVLLAVKPHLVYLLWLAILVDAVANRRWRILTGTMVAGLVMAALPLAFNPDVYSQYIAAVRDHPPAQWVTLTLGSLMRFAFGETLFGLQFVPLLIGLGWFAARWRSRDKTWDWNRQLPWLVLVSFVTAPYGAWHFDLVLLLIPLIHRAAVLVAEGWSPMARWSVAAYLAANLVMVGLSLANVASFWFVWVAPFVLVICAVSSRSNQTHPCPVAVPA